MSENLKVEPATTNDTVDAIAGSTQRDAFPLRRAFLQQKQGGKSNPGPLASFVAAGDRTGLLLYCLAVTKASKSPWDVSLHSVVWARALGFTNPTGQAARGRVSKTWSRLVDRKLVSRSRRQRMAEFTLLREDGSGEDYTRPTSNFINVPHSLWTEGPEGDRWYRVLDLPELTFLLIGLSNLDFFPLPAERGPEYYGISADTIQRGYQGLRRKGLLTVDKKRILAPLAPEGVTYENRYTLQAPFGPRGKASTAVSPVR